MIMMTSSDVSDQKDLSVTIETVEGQLVDVLS